MTGLHHRLRGSALASSIEYVGGIIVPNFLSGNSISLTSLTGGIRNAAAAGDIVIPFVVFCNGFDETLGIGGYTLLGSELYSAVNLRAAYKVQGGSPDTSVPMTYTAAGGGGGALAGAVVYRGQDGTPLDVSVVTATGSGNSNANPAAITPVTRGSAIVAIGAGGAAASLTAFTSSDLSNFITNQHTNSYSAQVGVGNVIWGGNGSFNPAAFGGGGTHPTSGWAALTIAIRST